MHLYLYILNNLFINLLLKKEHSLIKYNYFKKYFEIYFYLKNKNINVKINYADIKIQ